LAAGAIVAPLVLWPGAAHAGGTSLRADKVDKAPKLDGVPGSSEWPRELTKLSSTVKGSAGGKDLSAKAALQYDDQNLYVAADVTDDVLRGGADRVEVIVVVGSTTESLSLYPGQPGKSAGKAEKGGSAIKGAKVVEAPNKTGWTLEAAIPWSAIGDGQTRVGLKAGIFVHDADASDSDDAVVGTAGSTDASSLPALLTSSEQAFADGLQKDKRLGAPTCSFIDNVAGDGARERVMVFEHYLVVLGSSFRGGNEYYWNDMAVGGSSLAVQSCEARDADGDGKKDIVLRKRFTESSTKVTRDVLEILAFGGSSEVPGAIFRHEVGIGTSKGSITNDVSFANDGGKLAITITPGSARGLTEDTFSEPMETSFDPVLLPWGTIDSQTYKLKSGAFAKASEKTHKKAGGEQKSVSVSAPPPKVETQKVDPPKSTSVDSEKVYSLYKRDRSATGKARFDLSGDVDDDAKPERVLLHDKDLVVFGPAFKGGTGYAFSTLPFADASDIKSVSLRDVTGDKKSDIVVRGILKAKAPRESGGGDVEREVELVFRVSGESIKRVFGAEVGRSIGSQKIVGSISYDDKGSVTLGPGKAVGFTKASYPFNQDTGPVGGLEPLLLPWGDAKPVSYKWSGSSFSK
jgi:hypothetical protein